MVEHITTDEHTAYLTFRIRREQAAGNRIADVLAIALDASAKRPQ
jgi:hypothetical protein